MYRFLKQILYFIVLSLLLYVPSICLWGDLMPANFKKNVPFNLGGVGFLFTRLHDVKLASNVDVLVLGSSLAYRGFDPRLFKRHRISLFNLGSSAQTPIQTEILLNRYLKRLNPKTVILEVNPLYFSNDGVESSIDLFSNDGNDLFSLKNALVINNLKTYNTLVYGVYKDFSGYKSVFMEPIRKGEDTYILNGFVEKDLRYNTDQSDSNIDWDFRKDQLKAFKNILQLLKNKQIRYFLVQTPITKLRYDHIVNKDSFNDFMNECGTFYDFNVLMTLNDSQDFYDSHHLNQNGVVVFNELLIKTLFLEPNY